jgi:hypothetical protein
MGTQEGAWAANIFHANALIRYMNMYESEDVNFRSYLRVGFIHMNLRARAPQ